MSKLKESVQTIRLFFADVAAEMKKTTWPDRQELVSSTTVIIVSVVILSVVVAMSDRILSAIIHLLFSRG
jgi:preprotein translocase subunit SecE